MYSSVQVLSPFQNNDNGEKETTLNGIQNHEMKVDLPQNGQNVSHKAIQNGTSRICNGFVAKEQQSLTKETLCNGSLAENGKIIHSDDKEIVDRHLENHTSPAANGLLKENGDILFVKKDL